MSLRWTMASAFTATFVGVLVALFGITITAPSVAFAIAFVAMTVTFFALDTGEPAESPLE